ncbi:uncharacterized protein QC763_0033230, partial [Podospora pseudopauciseta]
KICIPTPTHATPSFIFAPPLFAEVSLANRWSAVCVPIPLPSNASNALRWEGLASIRGRVWDDVVLTETRSMVMLALYQGPLVLEESAAENAASIGQQPAGQVQSANQHDNPPATAFRSAPTRLSARPTLGMFHFGREPEPEPWRSGGPEAMPGYHRRWGKLVSKETSRTSRFRFEKQPSSKP